MIVLQYDIFDTPENREIRALERAVLELKSSNDKVRKSLFSKMNEFGKMYDELDLRLRIIEQNICQ